MTTPRVGEYVLATLLVAAVIGPAIAGLVCHLVWAGLTLGAAFAWELLS